MSVLFAHVMARSFVSAMLYILPCVCTFVEFVGTICVRNEHNEFRSISLISVSNSFGRSSVEKYYLIEHLRGVHSVGLVSVFKIYQLQSVHSVGPVSDRCEHTCDMHITPTK